MFIFYHLVPSYAHLLYILLFQSHSDDFPRRWCQSTLCTIRLRAWTEYIQVRSHLFATSLFKQVHCPMSFCNYHFVVETYRTLIYEKATPM